MIFTTELIGAFIAIIFSFVLYVKWKQTYWSRRNVPTLEVNGLWGNMENPFTTKRGIKFDVKNVYDALKEAGHKHGGFYSFTAASYIPVDLDLIKHILTKDFQYFVGHGIPINKEREPLTAHLFNLDGEEWKNLRVKLTPTFTSGKMKMMFSTLLECSVPLIDHIDKSIRNSKSLDIKEVLSCYTTDIIGSCAFGLECNSFKNPDAEFRKFSRKFLKPGLKTIIMQMLIFGAPFIRKILPLRFIPLEMEIFFKNVIQNVINYRQTSSVKRNDFIQLFLEINEKAKANGEEVFDLNQIAAQAFVFFTAGFETSSTTMTFCLHELAFNQEIQEKLRTEVMDTIKKYDGQLTYDGIMEMKYMDKVINETLRKYPPVTFINRICNKDYKVPNTDVTIEVGTKVLISTLGLHRDEEYFPDSEKFDPERFSEENKAKRPAYAFLPFGEGPRICIGLRFGMMQTKTGLAILLKNYKILPVKGESYNIEFDPTSFVFSKKGKLLLNAEKLSS